VIDLAITVATVLWLVEFGKGKETIFLNARRRLWLRRVVAEHFTTVIYASVAVAVDDEPAIIRTGRRPGLALWCANAFEIKKHSVSGIGHLEAITCDIN